MLNFKIFLFKMMKANINLISLLIGVIVISVFIENCQKDKPHSVPDISTTPVNITDTAIICGGNITNDGGEPVTARGVCWSISANPTILDSKTENGKGIGLFTSLIKGLQAATNYYVRAYAVNTVGTAYGEVESFISNKTVPTLSTMLVSDITATTATSGGTIISDGGSLITVSGICWSTKKNPTVADTKIARYKRDSIYTCIIAGLISNTTFYARAYATNSIGTGYGNEISFMTQNESGIVTDIDGNIYHTITIGTQVWMLENLKTTKYRNGDTLPNITSVLHWPVNGGAYCNYDNDKNKGRVYGLLYNWYASVDSRCISPMGWHVPTYDDWSILINFLGGATIAGYQLKMSGSNISGFTALPGGIRNNNGTFQYLNSSSYFLSSSEYNSECASCIYLYEYYDFITKGYLSKNCGFSVRCVKN